MSSHSHSDRRWFLKRGALFSFMMGAVRSLRGQTPARETPLKDKRFRSGTSHREAESSAIWSPHQMANSSWPTAASIRLGACAFVEQLTCE